MPTGVTFLEQVSAQAGKTLIPYRKYELDNGLTLILHEDHSDPLVKVDVTYHVGSAREDYGKSGFAHFFEHMMFQGSENVADEQHFKLVTEAGGTLNGSTSTDRTNYYQVVPANQLEKTLWLEADRMGFLLNAVTQEKFEVQRETVKNERGQRVDNRPYGRVSERVNEALYPAEHPYSWPTIGYIEDLNRVNVDDLKAFFLRWYGPNNATLTIGGDIDVEQTLALANKYFGSIPRGPAVEKPEITAVTLAADRYISLQDNVHLPLIEMNFPTVYAYHPDEPALDVLAYILGGGKTSLLYKNLVKNQLAVQAYASHRCSELACNIKLQAYPHPAADKSLAEIEIIIHASLKEFETRGVLEDDLIRAKALIESGTIFSLQSVSGKVFKLAAFQTFTGNPNYIEQDIERYGRVTANDVMRVYKKYLQNKAAVIMSVVPNGKPEKVAAKDNFKPPPRIAPAAESSASKLTERRALDDFDRRKIPQSGANRAVLTPKIWRSTLANGVEVLGSQSLEAPTTSLLLRIPAGHFYEDKAKAGSADLLARMLDESTLQRDSEAMSEALQLLGSSVRLSAGQTHISLNISSLSKNLDATIVLAQEKLLQPAFIEQDFQRLKNNAIQGVIKNRKNATYLASTAFRQLLFGNTIAGTATQGLEHTLNAITLADIKALYQRQIKAAGSDLIVVTDLSQKQLLQSLKPLQDLQGKAPELELDIPLSNAKTGVVYLLHKDKSAQSAIYIGKRSQPRDITGEFYRATLMNFPLGGAFNSRINLNLREDKGYTYGARSGFSGNKLLGSFRASAEVRADVTDKALLEFVREIKGFTEKGITAEELAFMRNAVIEKDALKYETPRAKLNFLAQILDYDMTPEFVQQQMEIVRNISAEQINNLAQEQLQLKDMVIVVVGDSKVLEPQLKALGYEVIAYQI
ncbi:MAG: zinc protease [Oceanicoccus sp.]|jgi:zinc protease